MNKFCFSKTYTFHAQSGKRKHYFFSLVERYGKRISFRPIDKGNEDVIPSTIVVDGDTETAAFLYMGKEYSLRADRFTPKGYPISPSGQSRKRDDFLKDAHLHTIDNRDEIGRSQSCGCISCGRIFPVSEVEDYIDAGKTAMCPYCDCDSLIADASGIELSMELLTDLNKKYF